MPSDWQTLAENTLAEFIATPVTAHESCGPQSEVGYLKNLGGSYVDTVCRVGPELDALQLDHPQVLEIGAYFGIVSVTLARAGIQVTAQDVSSVMSLASLRQRYENEKVSLSIIDDVQRPLPYADASFDALICCEMLEHLPFNIVRLMRELRRILRPGGFAFFSVPNQASMKRRIQLLRGHSVREDIQAWLNAPHDDNWHWHEWVGNDFRQLLLGCGFSQLNLGYRHFTPPAHPNFLRRALVNLIYRLKPGLMDDIYVTAR